MLWKFPLHQPLQPNSNHCPAPKTDLEKSPLNEENSPMHKRLEKKSIQIHMSSRSRVRPSLVARIPRLQRSDTNPEPERDEQTRAAQHRKCLRDDHHAQPVRFHPALTKKPHRRLCSLETPCPNPCRPPVFRTSSTLVPDAHPSRSRSAYSLLRPKHV